MKSQLRHRTKVCHAICQQKQNQFELLEHVLRSHICKVIVICHFLVFLLIIKIHSKWVHPVITSFAHCMCQVLVQAPVLSCLDCFFSFLRKCGMLCLCRKRIHYHVSVTWIMVTQPFILHLNKKTILVVKIIVIFQNSAHHYLQTTSKDAESVMLGYFLFITSHFST